MNLELYIARKIYFKKSNGGKQMPPAIRIAIAGVSLGLAIMILAVAIMVGFKNEIKEKVIGFGSHIQITNFEKNSSFETTPIAIPDTLLTTLRMKPEIATVSRFATKPGILKTDSEFAGMVFKGVESDYNWHFFEQYLTAGRLPEVTDSTTSNEILLSTYLANKLHIEVGDRIFSYFVQDNIRARRLTVVGLYQTNFSDYDKLFLIGDVRHIQQLNSWDSDQYSGMELMLYNIDKLQAYADDLYFELIEYPERNGEQYYVRSIIEITPQIFSWLELIDINVWVILVLISLVAGFTMISGLLIIILERTNMIGVLKALGANNLSIRRTFLYVSLFLVGKGVLWGNIIGVTLSLIQQYGKVIKLDPEVYYIAAVPIELNLLHLLLVNVGCITISMLMLIAPSYLISLIRPAKSLKFE